MRGHECCEMVMSLRFKSETVKEASFEMRHGTKIIHEGRKNYYIIKQRSKEGAGKRGGSADINDRIKRVLEGQRLRADMWLGCKEGMRRTLPFYLYFRLMILSSMLGETAFSFLNPESFPPFKTSLRTKAFRNSSLFSTGTAMQIVGCEDLT